jgi:hypothetical protein
VSESAADAMNDELDELAQTLRERSAEVSVASDYVSQLLSIVLSAAANRALAAAPNHTIELVLREIVFTVDQELDNSYGLTRAHAYPLADPLGASLDLAVRGISNIAVAVEVFARRDAPIAAATVQYTIRTRSRAP